MGPTVRLDQEGAESRSYRSWLFHSSPIERTFISPPPPRPPANDPHRAPNAGPRDTPPTHCNDPSHSLQSPFLPLSLTLCHYQQSLPTASLLSKIPTEKCHLVENALVSGQGTPRRPCGLDILACNLPALPVLGATGSEWGSATPGAPPFLSSRMFTIAC